MKRKDFMLALLIVIVWGANFTVIKLGLNGVPSMLLASLRYVVAVFPAIFIVKKPSTGWKYLVLYGLTAGVGQFACLFYAMELGMPAGLSSVLMQLQAFVSPVLGYFVLKEKLKIKQAVGILIALIGLFVIGKGTLASGTTAIPAAAVVLMLGGPLFWSLSNIVARFASEDASARGEKLDMMGLVVWSGLIPPVPLLMFSMFIYSPQKIFDAIIGLNPVSIFAILYIGLGATLFGFGFWNILLSKYSFAKISPLSLLVPVTGFLTSRIVLKEQLTAMQIIGITFIIAGLAVTNVDIKSLKKSKA